MLRMLAGSSLKYENQLSTAARRPIRPEATSSRTATQDGWRRYMNASMRSDALAPADLDHPLGVGRGQGQRLLAQDVLAGPRRGDRPLGVEVVRERDVDGVDLRVGEERLVGAVDARDPVPLGDRGARARSRDPIATTSQRAARRMPGMAFSVAIPAVDRIPQRSVVIAASILLRDAAGATLPSPLDAAAARQSIPQVWKRGTQT